MDQYKWIPQELKDVRQWHCWNFDSEGRKIPKQINGDWARSNDPDTWATFDEAVSVETYYQGIAFEITEPWTGIDLDDCFDDEGNLRSWALPIIARFDGIGYAEISPSKTGIKILTRARKLGERCVEKFGDGQQMEVYDHGRYWCMTGNLYCGQNEIGEGQAAVDWLTARYLAETKRPDPPKVRAISLGASTGSIDQRAKAYADSVPTCGKGGRNNAAFSLAGHLYSMRDEFGNRLSDYALLSYMQEWNARNPEPLSDKELQAVTTSGQKNGTARVDKYPQELIALTPEDHGVDLTNFEDWFASDDVPSSFPAECLKVPGLIGDIVEHNLLTAHYPLPELALAGALSLMATVTSGKIEGLRTRSNLYVMGLAPSGGGKDHSRKINRHILQQSGHPEVCGPERIGSHAGIVSAMAANWRQLFQIDEIGRLLATMQSAGNSPHLYNIASVLLQIYSSADSFWKADAYGDLAKVKTLEYPHCCVYGTSVPAGFWESLSKANLTDGLIGRFLVFENPEYVDFQEPEEREIPESVIERSKMWLDDKTHGGNLAGMTSHDAAFPVRLKCDEQAAERLKGHAIAISDRRKNEEHVTAAIWSRHAEKTNKIAMLFAASRREIEGPYPVINLTDADRAVSLNNWLTRRMLERVDMHVSENQWERDTLELLRLIKTKATWTQNELTRSTRKLKPNERHQMLLTLQAAGDIMAEEITTKGRRKMTFRAT